MMSVITSAQKVQYFDTSFVNKSSTDFFKRNPVVDTIRFFRYSDGAESIDIYKKTMQQDTSQNSFSSNYYKSYDLSFLGDRYFFEKKYGAFNFPIKEINLSVHNKCSDSFYVSGTIKQGFIKYEIQFYCPVKKDTSEDEMIFSKIEKLSGYKNGTKALQQHLQTAYIKNFTNKPRTQFDSALLFQVMIGKDSCLQKIELIEGKYSEFAEYIMNELKNACSWEPYIKDGRPTRSYSKIFVRLNKDNTITVAMPNRD